LQSMKSAQTDSGFTLQSMKSAQTDSGFTFQSMKVIKQTAASLCIHTQHDTGEHIGSPLRIRKDGGIWSQIGHILTFLKRSFSSLILSINFSKDKDSP
jgi:hypothetical protein